MYGVLLGLLGLWHRVPQTLLYVKHVHTSRVFTKSSKGLGRFVKLLVNVICAACCLHNVVCVPFVVDSIARLVYFKAIRTSLYNNVIFQYFTNCIIHGFPGNDPDFVHLNKSGHRPSTPH